jgi:hypothetical protein
MKKRHFAWVLANETKAGAIVDVGCGKGYVLMRLFRGTSAGARLPIYGIDPFKPYVAQAGGGRAGPETRPKLLQNLKKYEMEGKVFIIQGYAEQVVCGWNLPVGLLFVDTGQTYEDMLPIMDGWYPHVVAGGRIAISGYHPIYDQQVGVSKYEPYLQKRGFERVHDEQNEILVMERASPFYVKELRVHDSSD